jgi:hypothetical protein
MRLLPVATKQVDPDSSGKLAFLSGRCRIPKSRRGQSPHELAGPSFNQKSYRDPSEFRQARLDIHWSSRSTCHPRQSPRPPETRVSTQGPKSHAYGGIAHCRFRGSRHKAFTRFQRTASQGLAQSALDFPNSICHRRRGNTGDQMSNDRRFRRRRECPGPAQLLNRRQSAQSNRLRML